MVLAILHSSPSNTAYIEVQDADNADPVILSIAGNAGAVYEGEDVVFTVSRTGDTTSELMFKYDLIDAEGVIENEGTNIGGTIPADESSVQITHLTNTTGSFTDAAGVTLRLHSASEFTASELDRDLYRVADPGSLKIGVSSKAKPEITLSIDSNYILEGDDFELEASATPAPVRSITVNVTLSSNLSDAILRVWFTGSTNNYHSS